MIFSAFRGAGSNTDEGRHDATFFKNELNEYGGMTVVTDTTQSDREMHMVYTVTLGSGLVPTDLDPATQTGYGTITYSDDSVLTIKNYSMLIGSDGPISGTIETELVKEGSTTTTVMIYDEDGSFTGTIYRDGQRLATVHINADGTGTYTDSTGKVYPIT